MIISSSVPNKLHYVSNDEISSRDDYTKQAYTYTYSFHSKWYNLVRKDDPYSRCLRSLIYQGFYWLFDLIVCDIICLIYSLKIE